MSAAYAAPVHRGLQAQVHTGAFDFAREKLTSEPLEIGPLDIETSIDCYHTFDVRNFNLSIEFREVLLEPGTNTFDVDIQLGRVRGENIDVVGVSDWFDACIDIDITVDYFELLDGRLTGQLAAVNDGDRVKLAFTARPELTGRVDSQVNWFPDDLAWELFGEAVGDMVEDSLANMLPTLLDEPIEATIPTGFGDFDASIQISDVESSPDGVFAAADIDLGGEGSSRGPLLDLAPRRGSHFAVGLTEALAQEVLDVASAEGILAEGTEATEDLISNLQSTLGLGSVVPTFEIDGVPSLDMEDDGLRLSIPGVVLAAQSDGERILYLNTGLEATLALEVDPELGRIVLSTHDVVLDIREIDVSRLVRDEEGEEYLKNFIEGWVADSLGVMVGRIPLFSSNFPVFDLVIRLDEIDFQQDGVGAWFTVFDADDPAVDLVPPESDVAVDVAVDVVEVELSGSDDREGDLTYSYRVDHKTWSDWSPATSVTLRDLTPGEHEVEVRARDDWQNFDPTPATAGFQLGTGEEEEKKGCGCASPGPIASTGPWLLAALFSRRRR